MDLLTPINKIHRIGPIYASRLQKLDIYTIQDLLFHIPFRYDNFTLLSKINQLQVGETVTIQGTINEIKNQYIRGFRTIQKAKVQDDTGVVDIIWFNQPFLIKGIYLGSAISLSGKVDLSAGKRVLKSPEYEIIYKDSPTVHTARLVPIYPETRGVSSKWLRRQIYKILQEQKQNLIEYLPYSIIERDNLIGFSEAIEQVHFPKTIDNAEKARQRLSFDELFLIQMANMKRKAEWEKKLISEPFSISNFKKNIEQFWEKLSFELTNAQKKAVKEIFADLASLRPMNRLLEGDVGSGKTVVSAIAMYLAKLNGFQSVLMAPTEILANQHYETISKLLTPFEVKISLVTGSRKDKIEDVDIIVGTHAVLSKKINFRKLGLVVIDEQQRFGVRQRAIIRSKGRNPHFLTMTATPIPRTVALTLYGDLDLSILDEMPKGRQMVKTWLVPPEKRQAAYEWIFTQLKTDNSQLFVICPFIEESESTVTVKAATKEYERLRRDIFSDFNLGLLHGRLKTKEKQAVLKKFSSGEIDILVATPLVEVGIDIPNATIIIIEAAERFGLAQLHQLRGRVGRSDKQAYCLLFTESKNEQTIKRIKGLESLHVGAELAELDLKLRGPGEIYGTMQHGQPFLKVASFSDVALIEKAKHEAQKIFSQLSHYPLLQEKLKTYTIQPISPD